MECGQILAPRTRGRLNPFWRWFWPPNSSSLLDVGLQWKGESSVTEIDRGMEEEGDRGRSWGGGGGEEERRMTGFRDKLWDKHSNEPQLRHKLVHPPCPHPPTHQLQPLHCVLECLGHLPRWDKWVSTDLLLSQWALLSPTRDWTQGAWTLSLLLLLRPIWWFGGCSEGGGRTAGRVMEP